MPIAVQNKVKAMIRGEVRYTSKMMAFNLLINRLSNRYKYNPTNAELDNCFAEVTNFCSQFRNLIEPEYDAMAKA